MAGQDSELRLGTVTAIDAANGSLTVSLAGEVISGVRWFAHYSPAVNDFVGVLRAGASSWFVMGRLSKNLSAGGTNYGTATVTPAATWAGTFAMDDWSWAVSTDGSAGQGVHDPLYAGVPITERLAGVWYLPGVATAVPTGATITAAKLRLTRWAAPEEGPGITPEAALVTPRLRLHTYTTIPSGAPSLSASPLPQPWSPGSLAAGQPGVWDLPSAWLTSLLAGTSRGIAVDSSTYPDYTRFSTVQVELAYSVPA